MSTLANSDTHFVAGQSPISELPDLWLANYIVDMKKVDESDGIARFAFQYNLGVARKLMGLSHIQVMKLVESRGISSS